MRITREGWILILFGFLALSAFLRIYTPLTLLTSLVFFVIPAVSIFWAFISALGLRFIREIPNEGVAGEDIFVTYKIFNKSIFPAFGVRLKDKAVRGYLIEDFKSSEREKTKSDLKKDSKFNLTMECILKVFHRIWDLYSPESEPQRKGFEEAYHKVEIQADFPIHFPPLWRGQIQEKSIRLKFPVRGFYEIGPAVINIKDPLGLFLFTFSFHEESFILILPKWTTLKRFPMGGSSRILRDENIPIEREGWSPEFLGVREYREGDPLKAVHWKLTARHEQLMVKQFVQQVESSWGIMLDLKRGSNAGKGAETSLEYMISITAALLEHFDNEKIPHLLAMMSEEWKIFTALRGEKIFNTALRFLAACRNDSSSFLADRASEIVHSYPQLSWVLVTSRKDEDILNTVKVLSTYGGRVLVTQVDMNSFLMDSEIEAQLGDKNLISETLKKWRRMWGEELEGFETSVMSLGASCYSVSKGDNLATIYM